MSEVRVVLVTLPSAEAAEAMAETLVRESLAACGNVLPGITSIYRWEGRVERAAEALLVLKTTQDAVPSLLRRIPELHEYEVPEVLALPVVDAYSPYAEWVMQSVAAPSQQVSR